MSTWFREISVIDIENLPSDRGCIIVSWHPGGLFDNMLTRGLLPGKQVAFDGAINDDETPKISDALDLYLRLKGVGKDKVFFRTAKRNIRYVIKVLGNKSLKLYSSSDGGKFRDWLLEEGMSVNTVKRVFSSIRSIINIAISEYGLDCSNGFARTYFPNDNIIHIRKPLPIDKIKLVHKLCKEYNDDLRWLVALLSDTGMRLGEGGWFT